MITWNTATSAFTDKQKRVSAMEKKYSISLHLDIGIAVSDLYSHMVELLSTAPEALKQIQGYRTWTT